MSADIRFFYFRAGMWSTVLRERNRRKYEPRENHNPVPLAVPAALSLLRRYSGIDSEFRNGFGSLHSVIVSNPERK
jgi:hypothetical protein